MSTSLSTRPAAAGFARASFDFLRGLFTGASPAYGRATDSSEIWALYRMSRGVDTVPPAALRRLAERASQ
ncbi:hypothetical protein B0920_02645 [Massilia sp. KIM]|uniref:hypothetical protein n=1 Tax=Massilia sp. KIM TaxID=1955422 RepID=UPI00098F44E5|nr:hypothetical protein [Massilia sp. KIM]OON62385.1 hypothetical protein B0920_02645 [Massilia sp. KIM]